MATSPMEPARSTCSAPSSIRSGIFELLTFLHAMVTVPPGHVAMMSGSSVETSNAPACRAILPAFERRHHLRQRGLRGKLLARGGRLIL